MKLDFQAMTKLELRNYVLANRDDKTALQTYLDRLRADSPNSRTFKVKEDVGAAVSEYLRQKEISPESSI